MTAFLLLTFGVLGIYAGHRVLSWMDDRGWIYYGRRRGTSAALGNALLQVQTFYQPAVQDVLEARLEEPAEAADSGDPPSSDDDPAGANSADRG
jgi:hypothetical protein